MKKILFFLACLIFSGSLSSYKKAPGLSLEEAQKTGIMILEPSIITGKTKKYPEIPFGKELLMRDKDEALLIYEDGRTIKELFELLKLKRPNNNFIGRGEETQNCPDEDCWYRNENFFKKEKSHVGWRLVYYRSAIGIYEMHSMQTEGLINEMKKIFLGSIPSNYSSAVAEFESLKGNPTGEMTKLKVNKLFRENCADVFYRLVLYYLKTGHRLNEEGYIWTNSLTSDGKIAACGYFNETGAHFERFPPDKFFVDLFAILVIGF